jgi:hypothetical protein
MRREDVPYLTSGIADEIQTAFSRYDPGTPLYHPDRLLKLRDSVCSNVNIDVPELLQIGQKVEEDDAIKEKFIQLQKSRPLKVGAKKSNKTVANQHAGQIKARTIVREQGSSSLFGATVISSSSSKVNYAIQEVRTRNRVNGACTYTVVDSEIWRGREISCLFFELAVSHAPCGRSSTRQYSLPGIHLGVFADPTEDQHITIP